MAEGIADILAAGAVTAAQGGGGAEAAAVEAGKVVDNAAASGDAAAVAAKEEVGQKPGDWVSSYSDPLVKEFLTRKGWANIEKREEFEGALLKSYMNADKLISSGDKVAVPKDLDDKEGWDNYFKRGGWTGKTEDYVLQLPEGTPPEFSKAMIEAANEERIPPAQFQRFAAKYMAWADAEAAKAAAEGDAFVKDSVFGMEKLKAEWGQGFDEKMMDAQRAVAQGKVTKDELNTLEKTIGTKRMMEIFAEQGKAFGKEARFISGEIVHGSETPAGAKAKIEEMKKDQTWLQRYNARDPKAMEELTRLTKLAYPEPQAA